MEKRNQTEIEQPRGKGVIICCSALVVSNFLRKPLNKADECVSSFDKGFAGLGGVRV